MNAGNIFLKFFSVCLSVVVTLILIFLLYRVGLYSYGFGYRVFTEKPVASEENAKDKVVQITSDMGAKDIGDLLERKELISDANLFVVQLMLSAYRGEIKPGTYTLSTSMTAREMMQIMSAEEEPETEEET